MKTIHALAAAAALALGTTAFAGPVEVDFSSSQNLKGLGSFTGTAFYDNTTDKLTLNITNTSIKGALTSFAFEAENGDAAKYEHAKGDKWKDERNHKGVIKAKPFGVYEGGAGVNGKWGSTGVKKGIAAGQTKSFVFDITGANASSLTTGNFFTGTSPEIVATFAGFKHHKTDKAGGFGHVISSESTTTTDTTTNNTNTTPNTNTDSPILKVAPPPIITGGPITKPILPPPNGGSTSAVPLPPAAPAGLIMLGLIVIGGIVRKLRGSLA